MTVYHVAECGSKVTVICRCMNAIYFACDKCQRSLLFFRIRSNYINVTKMNRKHRVFFVCLCEPGYFYYNR